MSRRIANDEPELLELLAAVQALGDEVTWSIDLADGGAALAITLLVNHAQPVHHISGRAIHRAPESYRGEGKTDAKDAAVIADQVRIRRDLHPLRTGDETVTDLKILTGHRTDLVADRTHTVNRLRAQLTSIFPGLERSLDLTNTGPLALLTDHQAPTALRRTGKKRLETWLHNRKVLRADQLTETALEAAGRQHTSLPAEKLTIQMVHTLAAEVLTLNQQATEIDKAIEARLRDHRDFEVITSMPGPGVILGAEFLAATGGDMTAFGTADRLAGFGGVAPVPRDSEADALCNAEYGQVSDERGNPRNGYRPREWDTRAGTVELAVPRLRQDSSFPHWLLERRRRAEQALLPVVATAYLLGVSTRRVEKPAESLSVTQPSKSRSARSPST